MTALFESLLFSKRLALLHTFTQYDDEGYPLDDEYTDEEEIDEDLDDGFDNEDLEEDEEDEEWE